MISYCFAACHDLGTILTSKYTEYQHYRKDNYIAMTSFTQTIDSIE